MSYFWDFFHHQSRKQEERKSGGKATKEAKSKKSDDPEESERERIQFLQRVVLDYLAVNAGDDDQSTLNARHFYIRSAHQLNFSPTLRPHYKGHQ